MALKQPKTDDSKLNMTPMIDIVFQLILFFLLNMKFKSLDYRIESKLPTDRGLKATPQLVEEIPSIKVALFREKDEQGAENAFTKVKINGETAINLSPVKYTGEAKIDMKRENERTKEWDPIVARIRALYAQNDKFKGEIIADGPKGIKVPHADVIRVLDAFLEVGVKDVNFKGTPPPVPTARRQ